MVYLLTAVALAASPDSTDALLQRLGRRNVEQWSPVEKSRWDNAAYTLTGRKEARALPLLIAALGSKELGDTARICLRRFGQSGVEALINACDTADRDVRRQILIMLTDVNDPRKTAVAVKALKDPDVGIRRAAAYSLRNTDPSVIDPLVAALEDSDTGVRRQAVSSLGRLGDPVIASRLVPLLADEKEVARAAESALASFGDKAHRMLLAELTNPTVEIRTRVAELLKGSRDPVVIDGLQATLKDPDAGVRAAAVAALGSCQEPRVAAALTAALSDQAPAVRVEAAIALLDRGNTDAMNAILEAARTADGDVQNQAIWVMRNSSLPLVEDARLDCLHEVNSIVGTAALGYFTEHQDARAVEPLIALLKTTTDQKHRMVIEALANQRDARAVPVLLQEARNTDVETRCAAIAGLAFSDDPRVGEAFAAFVLNDLPLISNYIAAAEEIQDPDEREAAYAPISALDMARMQVETAVYRFRYPSARQALLVAMHSADNGMRAKAIEALATFGPAAVPPLLEALQDKNPSIRRAAARALGNIGDSSAVEALLQLAKERDRQVRESAISALAAIQDERTAPVMLAALRDADADIRSAALGFFEGRDISAFVPELSRMLADPDEYVRSRAVDVLAAVRDRRLVPVFIAALHADDETVRGGAAEALLDSGDRRAVKPLMQAFHMGRDFEPAMTALIVNFGDIQDSRELESMLEVLRCGRDIERHAAMCSLIGCKDPRYLNACVDYLLESSLDDVRERAFVPLQMAGPAGIEAIYSLLKANDPACRIRAMKYLVAVRDPRIPGVLIEALHDPVPEVRIAALGGLASLQRPEVGQAAIAALADENSSVRLAAIKLCGEKQYPDITQPLTEATHDADEAIRDAAVQSLVLYQEGALTDRLLTLLDDPRQQAYACRTLGEMREPRAVEPLIAIAMECLDRQELGYQVRAAVAALGEIGDLRAVEPLVAILQKKWCDMSFNSQFHQLGWELFPALGKMHDPRVVEPLLKIARINGEYQDDALRALGASRQPQALAYLRQLAVSPDFEERRMAAIGLGATGDPAELPLLEKLLADTNWDVRCDAAEGIGGIKDFHSYILLEAALHDPRNDVRRQAISSFGELGNPLAVPLIVPLLDDPDKGVRQQAAWIIEKLTGEEAYEGRYLDIEQLRVFPIIHFDYA
ncbi:MAG: HEAT repeat domain-containing protein [Armatimonadota bacterium]